ncbi:hypothetical protein DFH08DRAFT_812407 [Mycena albidolilacea]|uniref:Uncharacterized protein n=1 Tax=Mycena albidolilacea TaxID=1033008 RepID=A0AAD7EN83_9AGAR|nr:hypothetical protein DFH08DRAFT_812407 [Mycena albidolilacea]
MLEDVWARAPDEQENDLGEWLGLHTNRIGPANGGVLYRKNGCTGGGRKDLTEPAAHIRRRIECGSEVCEVSGTTVNGRAAYLLRHLRTRTDAITEAAGFCVHGWFDFSDRGKVVLNEPTIIGGKGFGSGQGGEKVGNPRIVVGRDLTASAILILLPNASQIASRSGYEELEKGSKFCKETHLALYDPKVAWNIKSRNACDITSHVERDAAACEYVRKENIGIAKQWKKTDAEAKAKHENVLDAPGILTLFGRAGGDVILKIKCLPWLANLRASMPNQTIDAWFEIGLDECGFILHRKRGGWARIAAGMVGEGREEENGSVADGSVDSSGIKAQKWLESRGCQNWTAEGRRKIL